MSAEELRAVGTGDRAGYSYPADLGRFVNVLWRERSEHGGADEAAVDAETLERFFSACYQASLLREEERPVTFRAILAPPALFAAEGRPPESLQRLEFSRSFPFDSKELRRLSVATDMQRTLIGVQRHEDGVLRIWGLINSGSWWLRDVHGGRRAAAPLPPAPVVHVDAPGHMAAYRGNELVAKLQRGQLSSSRTDPFVSAWLPEQFTSFRDELMARHEVAARRAQEDSGEMWAQLEPTLLRRISERMMKRVLSLLRAARHGGTIVFVPKEKVEALRNEDPYIDLKYRFRDGPTQHSFPDLVLDILNRLAQLHGGEEQTDRLVGWGEFEGTTDHQLVALDEALFETAHLIARLASADGAVVMTKQHDLLGSGGMISGRLPAVRTVWRTLDLEGDTIAQEPTENVGSRHRSAYRLAAALPGAVVIVISQDGGVRFVAQKNGRVTYWEQE
jgi:hypothetical protein